MGVSTTPFNLTAIRKFTVWYTARNGNWYDASTWISNGKKRSKYPKNGDTVYISHNVLIDSISFGQTISVRDLFITVGGKLRYTGPIQPIIKVNGILDNAGEIDFTGGNARVLLYGYINKLGTYTYGTSCIEYAGTGEQAIDCTVSYYDLNTSGGGIKICTGDLNVYGTLSPQFGVSGVGIDFKGYNSFVNLTGGGAMYKSLNTGRAIFAGLAKVNVNSTWDFRGNGDVEFRGGWITGNDDSYSFYTGTGNYYFTTNNQSVLRSYIPTQFSTWKCNVFIGAGIEITLGDASSFIDIVLGNPSNPTNITGLSSTSKLILNNARVLQTQLTPPMTTGIYDTSISGKTSVSIGYYFNVDYNLPDIYYPSLVLHGTGKASLIANLNVNGNLMIGGFGQLAYLETTTFNVSVDGTVGVGGGCTFSKISAGSLLFKGQFAPDLNSKIVWTGNPTIESRGGIKIGTNGTFSDSNFNFGNNTWTFTTNNQNLFVYYLPAFAMINPVVINDITLTIGSNGGSNSDVRFDNTINGTTSNSKLSVAANCRSRFNNPIAPMTTGQFSFSLGSFQNYEYAGSQQVTGGTYGNLTLKASGTKKLLNNVSVLNNYSLVAPALLDTNGYNLTNP